MDDKERLHDILQEFIDDGTIISEFPKFRDILNHQFKEEEISTLLPFLEERIIKEKKLLDEGQRTVDFLEKISTDFDEHKQPKVTELQLLKFAELKAYSLNARNNPTRAILSYLHSHELDIPVDPEITNWLLESFKKWASANGAITMDKAMGLKGVGRDARQHAYDKYILDLMYHMAVLTCSFKIENIPSSELVAAWSVNSAWVTKSKFKLPILAPSTIQDKFERSWAKAARSDYCIEQMIITDDDKKKEFLKEFPKEEILRIPELRQYL